MVSGDTMPDTIYRINNLGELLGTQTERASDMLIELGEHVLRIEISDSLIVSLLVIISVYVRKFLR